MSNGITRRAILAALPLGLGAAITPDRSPTTANPSKKLGPIPNAGEFVRFIDPVTENPVVRLTTPSTASLLPAANNRFISVRDRFLVFSSDRSGRFAPYHLDLRTGALTLLAPTHNLDPRSLSLDERQKDLFFLDGGVLNQFALSSKRPRVVADNVTAFDFGKAPSSPFIVVRNGNLAPLNTRESPLAENVSSWCLLRPNGKGCLFGREPSADAHEFWYVPLPAAANPKTAATNPQPTLLAKGRISDPFWSPDGQSLLFLREIETANGRFSEIHEVFPETQEERRVDQTSQFAAFAPNTNATVFVGASRSKAQPTVILLVRSVQRELTLCEHHSSHAAAVSPVFSLDSRRVYFQSDREGKSALYSVNVELLVEPTSGTAL